MATKQKKKKKNAKLCSFPVETYLAQFEQLVKDQSLFVCTRLRECTCKDSSACVCDNDEYFPVQVKQCELASNCKYLFSFSTDPQLATSFSSKRDLLRLFYMDTKQEDAEIPLLDIDVKENQVTVLAISPKTTFLAGDITREAPSKDYFGFSVSFDYMSFSNKDNAAVKARNEKPSF